MRRGELRGLSNLAASGVMFAAAVPYTARGRPSSHLGHGTPHVSRGFPPTHLKGQDVQTLIALHTWSHEDESDRRGKIVVGRIVVGRIVVGRIVTRSKLRMCYETILLEEEWGCFFMSLAAGA